ncbi:hypothetical protein [Brevibacillus dissolubilis]|uniref:hypothetical protein n=1 Tax=Brevibacillus dissolubilis TaxID=1844116 RepID=UPI0011163C22|nr:hypothetical protein [Brevibacillus dissolubilis]
MTGLFQVMEAKRSIDKIVKETRHATAYHFEVADFHSYFVSNLGISVHNCAAKVDNKKLSSPNPILKAIREQYEEILLGRGTPRLDANGKQKIFGAMELKTKTGGNANVWAGSLEYDIPGTNH